MRVYVFHADPPIHPKDTTPPTYTHTAAQQIMLGQRDIVVAGGMESMSNIPHYVPAARGGVRLGNATIVDGIVHDGLWDVYNDQHMGMCAEACAAEHNISREDQDAYAIESYARASAAMSSGLFDSEIIEVEIKGRRGKPSSFVSADEEPMATDVSKIPSLQSAFKKEGTVTAANASSLNDGAAAFVLMSADKVRCGGSVRRSECLSCANKLVLLWPKGGNSFVLNRNRNITNAPRTLCTPREQARELGVKPLARIKGFGDAEQDPVQFTTAPSLAVPRALAHAGVTAGDIDFHEINEAFSVVALANMQLMDLDFAKVRHALWKAKETNHISGMARLDSSLPYHY